MRYCVPLGLPHSEFLSWDESDQDKAIALQSYEGRFCQQCGTRDEDWRDDKKRLLDVSPFIAEGHRCAGCVELEAFRAREDVKKHPEGLTVRLRPRRPEDDLIQETE